MKTRTEQRRTLWLKREQANLCVYCGKHKPQPTRKGCDKCLKTKTDVTVRFSKRNPETARQYHLRIKHEVIAKYGGKCKCCGESEVLFLTIDHSNNDGCVERKEPGCGSSKSFYLKLKREPVRQDLQVLCWNCNMGKVHNYGICPHGEVKRILVDFVDGRRKSVLNKGNKIAWPGDELLIKMCNNSSVAAVAKQLGVDFSTISGRLKRRNKYNLVVKHTGPHAQR